MNKPENLILVIFGASGDLTKRKLVPSLYDLYVQNLLPDSFGIIGVGRTKLSDEGFRDKMVANIKEFAKNSDANKEDEFAKNLYYQSIDTQNAPDYEKLKIRLDTIDADKGTNGNCIFYLATPPSLYEVIPKNLGQCSLEVEEHGWRRLIVEKPFGYNLESTIELNKKLLQCFKEEQIYRIDHYLGKETVQNVLVTRFSNGFFEPIWNRNYIHHVEITASESLGVEDRGGYYDGAGALRDMLQNHLLQLVGLVAMEPPSQFDSDSIRNETVKVFKALRPIKDKNISKQVIRGQYVESVVRGEKCVSYLDEKGIKPNSKTETFVAIKFFIDNWRWSGVPFYIRTGKHLPTKVTEIVIHLNASPHRLFRNRSLKDSYNHLIMRIQPDEGIVLNFGMKIPGRGFNVQNADMDFKYSDLHETYIPTAYERLLLDCMLGDSTLYSRGDAVEATWNFVKPIQEAWENNRYIKLYGYPCGSWGPEEANDLFEDEKMTWRYPCKNLVDRGYCEL